MRYQEIDVLRGLAVIGMIIYHFLVDLEIFYGYKIGVFDYPVALLARIVGITFIALLGMSAQLQFKKTKTTKVFFKRAAVILFWALIITLITYALFPQEFIWFGILHLVAVSLCMLALIVRLRSNILLFLLGLLVITAGLTLNIPAPITLDYYPILPWFGIAIWGVVLGRVYPIWRQKLPFIRAHNKLIAWLGKNSLGVYIAHQPILLTILYVANRIV